MTPERWAQIEELFHRTVECDPRQRASLLDEACNGDSEMRREVEALLASEETASDHMQAAVRCGLDAVTFPLVGEIISHYRILDGLGGGGMGSVYRAEDVRLGRQVALKFLPEESTKNPAALRRFEREARSASALEHPNICPIYEFGEHEGQPFLAMQLLKGQTLREAISTPHRGRAPLPVDRLLDLAIQIASGLEAAHSHGIIHRDIKPANIFVTTQGQAIILDFGLAKLFHSEAIEDEWERTPHELATGKRQASWKVIRAGRDPLASLTGAAIATAGYMSPEQLRGERLDARTDLFSFGAVLYEMATGQMAFFGNTGAMVNEAITEGTPTPLTGVNPNVPSELESIVNKALEKDRELRYNSVAELRMDLKRLKRENSSAKVPQGSGDVSESGPAVAEPPDNQTSSVAAARAPERIARKSYALLAACVGLDQRAHRWRALAAVAAASLLAAAYLAYRGRTQYAARPTIKSLAVLPLKNLSGDATQEYFADGMTEALITELGKTSIPRVISRQSILQYKDSKKPLQEIARELNVDAVLEGTVLRSGDRVRVTVHLDRASPEGQLWGSAYDRSERDVLGLQNEIARAVTDEIQVKLTPRERARLAGARPVDPEAHDEYLRGRYILGMAYAHLSKFTDKRQYTDADILEAIGYFKRAIEKDPAYAIAYAGLADAHIQLGNPVWGGHSPKETLSDAKGAAIKALELDPSLAEAHFSLAQTLEYDWNWSEAEKEFKLALKLNLNNADAHLEYGRFLQAIGRNDEALREMNYAIELNPFDIRTKIIVAWVTFTSRQYDLALQQFKNLGDDVGVMAAYREKEMYPEALAALERWKLDHPGEDTLAAQAGIYGLQGRKHEAEKLIDELKETARHQYVSGFFFAEAYVGLGQKDQAITWLERAYEDHDQWMVYVAAYPDLDPLHSEPRFQDLLRRMNFPK